MKRHPSPARAGGRFSERSDQPIRARARVGLDGRDVVFNRDRAADPALALALDRLGEPAVRSFVEERDLSFTVLLDPDRRIERRYQVRGLPTSYLIDRDGVIRRTVLGPAEWDQPPYSEWVRELLGE